MSGGFQIVQEAHAGDDESFGQGGSVNEPGQIGRSATVVDHRSSHAQTGCR